MKDLLQKHNMTLYSTKNEEKSIVCERWNRKIKTKMWKQFTVQGNTVYYMAESVFAMPLVNLRSVTYNTDQNF